MWIVNACVCDVHSTLLNVFLHHLTICGRLIYMCRSINTVGRGKKPGMHVNDVAFSGIIFTCSFQLYYGYSFCASLLCTFIFFASDFFPLDFIFLLLLIFFILYKYFNIEKPQKCAKFFFFVVLKKKAEIEWRKEWTEQRSMDREREKEKNRPLVHMHIVLEKGAQQPHTHIHTYLCQRTLIYLFARSIARSHIQHYALVIKNKL